MQAAAETRRPQRIAGIWRLLFVGWVFSIVIGPQLRLLGGCGRTGAARYSTGLRRNGPPGAPAGPSARGRCGLYKEVM